MPTNNIYDIYKNVDISRRHNNYNVYYQDWCFYKASYIGGNEYILNTIYNGLPMLRQHKRELDNEYKLRRARSYYLNYCKFVIETYGKFIFSGNNDIIRLINPENPVFDDIIYNFDGKGLDANAFMQKLFQNALIYGEYYVLIDKPIKPDNLSKYQTEQLKLYPYCKQISPLELLDYSLNDFGNYNWCLIREEVINNTDPFKPMLKEVQHRLITTEYIYLYGEDGNLKEGYPLVNELGRVPLVKCVFTDIDNDGIGESLLKDISWINNEIYNICSFRSEDFRNNCFPQLYGSEISGKKGEEEKSVLVGNTTYFPVPTDGIIPGYISPDTSTITIKQDNIDNLVTEILRLAGLQKDDAVMSSSVSSGISKAISFLDTNQSFAEKARRLQDTEYIIWDYISQYQDIKQEITIDYPTEFNVMSKTDKIKIGLDLTTISKSDTLNNTIVLQLATENFAMTDNEIEIIKKELEESTKPKDDSKDMEENIDTNNENEDNDNIANEDENVNTNDNQDIKETTMGNNEEDETI
jgi:hypothetical protein